MAAIIGGIGGALAMSAILMFARVLGVRLPLEELVGAMFVGGTGSTAVWLGFATHLAFGAFFGLAHHAVLLLIGDRGRRAGAVVGACHAVVAGFVAPLLAPIHPLVFGGKLWGADTAMTPSAWPAAILFLAVHIYFGMVVADVASPSHRGEMPRRDSMPRRTHASCEAP